MAVLNILLLIQNRGYPYFSCIFLPDYAYIQKKHNGISFRLQDETHTPRQVCKISSLCVRTGEVCEWLYTLLHQLFYIISFQYLKSYRKITPNHWPMHSIGIDFFLGKGKGVCLILNALKHISTKEKKTTKKKPCRTFEKALLA